MIGQPLRVFAQWLLLLASASINEDSMKAQYEFTVTPAWNSYINPETPSELNVRLMALSAVEARIIVRGSRIKLIAEQSIEPGVPEHIQVPLVHDSVEPVTVELHVDDRLIMTEELQLKVLPPATDVVAVAGNLGLSHPIMPKLWSSQATELLHIDATKLPRSGQSYGLLSALLLSGSALRDMDNPQRQALGDYVRACGVVYLTGISAATINALQNSAGCRGRNVINLRSERAAVALPAKDDPLPGAASLRQLVPGGHNAVLRSLFVFLAAYVVLLVLVARSTASALTLAALPPAATALALLGWSLGSPVIQIASWAEMESGDHVVQFSGIVRVIGVSRETGSLALPLGLGMPSIESARELHVSQTAAYRDLRLDTQLLTAYEFVFAGTAPGPALDLTNDAGTVRVINRGDTPSGPGVLAWQGQRYTVPELAAGQAWRRPPQAEPWGNSPQERLLRQRAAGGGSWMLVPFGIPELQSVGHASGTKGWLLVKGNSDV